jgi:hypothetical protein
MIKKIKQLLRGELVIRLENPHDGRVLWDLVKQLEASKEVLFRDVQALTKANAELKQELKITTEQRDNLAKCVLIPFHNQFKN